jgi:hypothetical protein
MDVHVTHKISTVGSVDQRFWIHVKAILQISPCVLQNSTHSSKIMRHNYFTYKPLTFIKIILCSPISIACIILQINS